MSLMLPDHNTEEINGQTFVKIKGKDGRDFKVPLANQFGRKEQSKRKPVKRKNTETSDDSDSDYSISSDDSTKRWKEDDKVTKRTLKQRKYYKPSLLQQKTKCHLCNKIFPRSSRMFIHQRQDHPEYWAQRP